MSKELFDTALKLTLQYEGGYVNNINDPGSETNKGIIKSVYDNYRTTKNLPLQSVKDITDTEVEDIYYNQYWVPAKCEEIEPISKGLAVCMFDTSVNTGVGQASKFLQHIVGATADGMIGPGTLGALKTNYKDSTIEDYLQQREAFYKAIAVKNPNLNIFLTGWLSRVNSLRAFVANLS